MDKMLVDSLGDVTVTSDGATVLDEIDVQHPAAKMLVEIAKTQDDEVGDGTTTAVVLAGELLKKAEGLLDQGLHPTIITAGYRKAADYAVKTLNEIAVPVKLDDTESLRKIAITAMHGKGLGSGTEHFANIAVEAVTQVMEKRGDTYTADIDNIQLVKKEGKSLLDTSLVRGVIIDKEVVHPGMPKRIEKAKIALLDTPMEIEKTEFSAEIKISNPQQMQAFLDEETNLMKEMAEKIKGSGANVVLCQKGIDEVAQSFLARYGILASRRSKKSDIEKLSKATGAKCWASPDRYHGRLEIGTRVQGIVERSQRTYRKDRGHDGRGCFGTLESQGARCTLSLRGCLNDTAHRRCNRCGQATAGAARATWWSC